MNFIMYNSKTTLNIHNREIIIRNSKTNTIIIFSQL